MAQRKQERMTVKYVEVNDEDSDKAYDGDEEDNVCDVSGDYNTDENEHVTDEDRQCHLRHNVYSHLLSLDGPDYADESANACPCDSTQQPSGVQDAAQSVQGVPTPTQCAVAAAGTSESG